MVDQTKSKANVKKFPWLDKTKFLAFFANWPPEAEFMNVQFGWGFCAYSWEFSGHEISVYNAYITKPVSNYFCSSINRGDPIFTSKNSASDLLWAHLYIVQCVHVHCKDKIPKFRNKYYQKRNIGVLVPISTFMRLWAIYIFPRSVCLFCWRKYLDRSWD